MRLNLFYMCIYFLDKSFVLAIFLFFVPLYPESQTLEGAIASISIEDRDALEAFFRVLISSGDFGYVIYGSKPMAAVGLTNNTFQVNAPVDTQQRIINKGWEVWSKYHRLFPITRFVLRLSQNPLVPSDYWMVLINKERCRTCIASNLDLFTEALGQVVSPEEIVEGLEKKAVIFTDVLKSNDGLLGILFGYGRHNSMLFHQQKQMRRKGLSNDCTAIVALQPFNQLRRGERPIDLPRFAMDPSHLESVKLREEYEKTCHSIESLYKDEKFLERTLTELTK